jgi:hypothetical protein
LSYKEVKHIVSFIENYAETNGILLPGYKRSDLKLLPSSTSKRDIHTIYMKASEGTNIRVAASTTFNAI